MNIAGKTVLITGGASGIGLEAARQLLAAGARVIITGRNAAKLAAAQQQLPALVPIRSDVADATGAMALLQQVEALGGIDILYNNAGVGVPPRNLGLASDQHLAGAAYEMDVNYLGVVRLNNLFLPMLQARPESAIINTTSVLRYVPSLHEATYSASKAALGAYTQVLRKHLQLLGSRVRVFELLPPLVDTDMTSSRADKKISPAQLVRGLLAGLQKDQYTIRVGDTRLVYLLHRFFPKLAFGLVNPASGYGQLRRA